MGSNHPFSTTVISVLLVTMSFYAVSAYGDSDEVLDVNLNSIYLKNRSQKDYGLLSEVVLQLPYPISDTAKKTGKGLFGGLYFDDKMLATANSQSASVLGVGRVYYSTTAPGATPTTFVPYLNGYRALYIDYPGGIYGTYEQKTNTWLTPGFMYSYRIQRKLTYHLDMELYSYSRRGNNRFRTGFSYLPKWPVIFSASYERLSWDLDENVNGNIFAMNGNSGEYAMKVIVRDPPNGNFSLIIGYGTFANAANPGFAQSEMNSKGKFIGVEATAGVLAW